MWNIYFDIILSCNLKPELCFMLDTCEQFSDTSQLLFGNCGIICAKPAHCPKAEGIEGRALEVETPASSRDSPHPGKRGCPKPLRGALLFLAMLRLMYVTWCMILIMREEIQIVALSLILRDPNK